jgi:16S rRNA (cytidine1402-2'-O)-methyltransferase
MSGRLGRLILVPSPIEEIGEISESLKTTLLDAFEKQDIIVVEDPKPARRRWLGWGLPRAAIENFVHYNEHTRLSLDPQLLDHLKEGRNVFMLSDGGLPGFCDPGRSLIFESHKQGFEVTMTPFPNSLLSAITLSGFTEGPFEFLGFPPKGKDERKVFFNTLGKSRGVSAFMDTPYRLERVLEECQAGLESSSLVCIALDIGRDSQEIIWGKAGKTLTNSLKKGLGKREFVFVVKS